MDYTTLANLIESEGSAGAGGGIFSFIMWAALLVANWFLFEKAGEPGWYSIIPFFSIYKMFEIVYGNGWKALLLLVPLLNIVVGIAFAFRYAQAYGQGILWGFIMLFFPNIATLYLAFGPAKYTGPTYSFI